MGKYNKGKTVSRATSGKFKRVVGDLSAGTSTRRGKQSKYGVRKGIKPPGRIDTRKGV